MCKTCEYPLVVNRIRSTLDLVNDLPEKALNFGASVEEKLESIWEWIEENKHVTEAQKTAVENMREGVKRWLPDG